MPQTSKLARRIGISLIGFPLLVIGLLLIPLPGPGIAVTLLALFILATEFEWARRHAQTIKRRSAELASKAKRSRR